MTTAPHVTRRHWLGLAAGAGAGLAASAAAQTLPPSSAVSTLSAAPETNGRAAAAAPAAASSGARVYNIRDFGARGDGATLDTAALQAAIDACHGDGGGTVLVPAGTFLIGTTELKSHVTLHLAAQATLLGSAKGGDYHAAAAIPLTGEHTMGDGNVGLLFAANAENITIEGQGTIDGQGAQFRRGPNGEPPASGRGGNQRPHHVLFYKVKNLTLRDIFLRACAYHSVRVCVSQHVKIGGIRIHSRVNGNNDGLHFISCQFVHVSDCDIQCQDDACALFGSCKFITVTNCTFSTRWSVFRFGTGEAENITVSNCVIYQTYGCPIKLRCDSRSRFENMVFANLVMHGVTGPISIGLGEQRPRAAGAPPLPAGIVRNIAFRGIRATVVKPVPLPDTDVGNRFNPGEVFSCIILNGAHDEGFIENISLDDVQVEFPGGGTAEHAAQRAVPKIANEYFSIGVPPAHALFARRVRGLTLQNVRFTLAAPDARPALVMEHVEDAHAVALTLDGAREAESALRLTACRDVLLTAPRLRTPAAVFLRAEGETSAGIAIDGGDIGKAAHPVALKAGAPVEAVKVRTL
jgi:polygalacturonase